MSRIDLNADVGEGGRWDAELIPLLTSANIACGGHAGDRETMVSTLLRAKAAGVAAGAHPGYPDRAHFGRIRVEAPAPRVRAWVREQITDLLRAAAPLGLAVRHVKPHGALYLEAATDQTLARTIAEAVAECDPQLALFALPGSALEEAGKHAGLAVVAEGFPDRAYLRNGALAPRSRSGAVLTDPGLVVEQALRLAQGRALEALDGGSVAPAVHSLCIHGDGPHALEFAQCIRRALENAGIRLAPFGGR